MTFCKFVDLYDRNCITLGLKKLHLNILWRVLSDQAISTLIYKCSEMFRVSVVFSVASQQSILWRNVSRSTGKQKTF